MNYLVILISLSCLASAQVEYFPVIASGENVLVVYNDKYNVDEDSNGVKDGKQIAEYYQAVRNIPAKNVVSISCDDEIDYFKELDSILAYLNKKDLVVYYDARYPVSLVTAPDLLVKYYEQRNGRVKDAGHLKQWLSNQITRATAGSSLVIMSMGVMPDSIVSSQDDSCLIKKYLNCGGTVIWLGDKQFYYQGHSDGTMTEWGDVGSLVVLGVRNGPNYHDYMAVATDSGENWGLRYPELAFKTSYLSDVSIPLSVSANNDSIVCSWLKCFNDSVPKSGFLRLRSDYFYCDNVIRHGEISRSCYNEQIKTPIENYLISSGLKDDIRYIVLTKGVPLKIVQNDKNEFNFSNRNTIDRSSVDAALCLMFNDEYEKKGKIDNPFEYFASGFVESTWPRPYYNNLLTQRFESFSYSNGDVVLSYLVSRLDGYNIVDVLNLIDRAPNAYLNDTGYIILDADPDCQYLNKTKSLKVKKMLDYISYGYLLDTTSNWILNSDKGAIAYYSNGVHAAMPEDYLINSIELSYLDGAIFVSGESYNGYSFMRNGNYGGHSLVADFIQRGGTGAYCSVYEPFLFGLPQIDILTQSYVLGYNLIDSFYKSLFWVDWQGVVIGDPLCRIRTTPNVPMPPGHLNAKLIGNFALITWSSQGQNFHQGYDLYRSNGGLYYPINSAPLVDTFYIDSTLNYHSNYYYKVVGRDTGDVESPPTNTDFVSLDSLLIKYTFNDSNTVGVFDESDGDWGISDGVLIGQGYPDGYGIVNCNLSDFQIIIDVVNMKSNINVFLQWENNDNCSYVEFIDNDSISIINMIDGSSNCVYECAVNPISYDNHLVMVRYVDGSVMGSVDDRVLFEFECNIENIGNNIGIGFTDRVVAIDNFIIKGSGISKIKDLAICQDRINVYLGKMQGRNAIIVEGTNLYKSIELCDIQGRLRLGVPIINGVAVLPNRINCNTINNRIFLVKLCSKIIGDKYTKILLYNN